MTCEKHRLFVSASPHTELMQTLVAQVQLRPSAGQASALQATLRRANAAANHLSGMAWEQRAFRRRPLQKVAYHQVRETTGLSAQVVIRLIAKVADAYKKDRKVKREFDPLGAIAYDARILRWFPDASTVSIWTVAGRQVVPFVCGAHQAKMLGWQRGESDLVLRDGKWYLYASVAVPERVQARKPQRATLASWSFHQLGTFVAYKAALSGVPVVFVDPAHTSQECPSCHHTCRANRTRQARFNCVSCGLAGPADAIAALNIRARGRVAVMRPDAGEPGGLATAATHGAAGTVPPAGDLASSLL